MIKNLFTGLTKEYYLRQLFFGSLIFTLITAMTLSGTSEKSNIGTIIIFAINTILYPYSRFAYESIVEFILGDTILFSSVGIFSILKIITMFLCWMFAIFIAPVGLLIIYLYQRNQE